MIATKSKIKPLGEYLLEAGLLSPDRLKIALDKQKNTSLRLGELLSSLGWVSQETIEYLIDLVAIVSIAILFIYKRMLRESRGS